ARGPGDGSLGASGDGTPSSESRLSRSNLPIDAPSPARLFDHAQRVLFAICDQVHGASMNGVNEGEVLDFVADAHVLAADARDRSRAGEHAVELEAVEGGLNEALTLLALVRFALHR